MGDVVDAVAAFEHPARRIRRAQRLMAAADQQVLGHGEAQERGLLRGAVDVAHEVGEHAVDAVVDDMELLERVVGQQQLARKRRQRRCRNPRPRPRIGQVEMQPEPAVMAELDRPVDRQRLGAAVAVQAERPDQARNGRLSPRYRADKLCRLSHGRPNRQQMPRLRKMADGIVRIHAGTQLRLCYSLMMAPPYSAASPVAAAASASLI
ncbi:hypothetical protein ACVIWV_003827 [Bradyrhizobium diazoefficiens]